MYGSAISGLLSDLRREKVLGVDADPFTFSLMWQGKNAILLSFFACNKHLNQWCLVERSSRQYYKVTILRDQAGYRYVRHAGFRNSRLTTDYIKEFLK